MNNWNKKNVLWMLLYVVIYAVFTAIVCVTGAIHPVLFVCYQITAGVLLSGVVFYACNRVKAPGVCLFMGAGMLLLLLVIQDAVAWHVIPIIIIAALAEVVRLLTKYNRIGDIIATVIMTFSSFGYYGQIWFNRDYTYECAVEEMPAGYGDGLMSLSPAWAFIVVVIVGIAVSVIISNITAKVFKLERQV
ncbi:MAG: MptD family putative ECF transporter S component [Lachnospiraceae bacterium]|nr:MptD family putative ECF transporter S component [Lachnospiraceae bacterium]MBQ8950086.1 MptD family putative ECF transporter S component [Eubacterium sp.]